MLVTVVAAGAVFAAAAGAAGDPIRDASNIVCPPGPPNWSINEKKIWDGRHDVRLAGLQQVAVNCNYVTSNFDHIEVSVSYALPTDVNPVNDFYFGCSSGGIPWTATDRTFHVSSPDQWAIATFNDLLRQISEPEARAFQNVTRQLLKNAEGYGHACTLNVAPTQLKARFTFSFQADGGNAQGSFYAQGLVNPKTNSVPVVQATVRNFALKVNGTKSALVLAVKRGIDYHPPKPTVARQVRLAVQVVDSKLASCRKGATGTLTITTAPSVRLAVCGKTFLRGKATAQIAQD
jgi:hypothetical protein